VDVSTTSGLAFAERLAGDLAGILGADLVGVYLHGSVAMGCFNPDRSDVDLLAVTRTALLAVSRRSVAELMLARSRAPYPVELSVLTTRQLHPWRHPAPFDFHYSETWRESISSQLTSAELDSASRTDPDLAGHITTLRARGRVLLGAPIQHVFPQVPEADFRQAILADLEWIGHHSTQIYGPMPTSGWRAPRHADLDARPPLGSRGQALEEGVDEILCEIGRRGRLRLPGRWRVWRPA
jgi:hypothetical protein